MKRKLHSTIAAIAFMVIGHSVSAQTEVIYNFNTDLTGVTVNAGTAVSTNKAGLTDNGVSNSTNILKESDGTGAGTSVYTFDNFVQATDYSITWKEYISAVPANTNNYKKAFLLRGTSTVSGYAGAPTLRRGYLCQIQNNGAGSSSPGSVSFQIRQSDGTTGLTNLGSAVTKVLDGGTNNPMTPLKAYWYRVSVSGATPVVIKIDYSVDGITFLNGVTYNDNADTYTGAGITQILSGIGGARNTYYFDDVKFNSPPATNTATNTTWNGSSWDNGAPVATSAAIINGNYSEAANIVASTLKVSGTAVATIPSGYYIKLTGAVSVDNTASLTLENNANLIQVNNPVNTGNITVKRNSNALKRLDYTMWSSPVAAQNLAAFSPLTSQSPSRFYTYDGPNNVYVAVSSPTTTNFTAGTGYLIRMPNEDATSGYNAGTQSIVYNGVFTGVPNNGNVSQTGLTASKFYAVGNPYSSTISATSFLTGNPNILGTLYFWRKTNGVANSGSAYATWTTAGGTAGGNVAPNNIVPNGIIQVGQGFVINTNTATSVNFTNAMRETTPSSTQFLKIAKETEKSRVWLNLTSEGLFSQALVAYMDGATEGVDNGIDGKYINDSKIALTSDINGEEYTIQGRPAFDKKDVVALNFKTDKAAEYKIAIDHVDGLFSQGQEIYLVDSVTGTETNLSKGAYTFTAESGSATARFALKYESSSKVVGSPVFDENTVTLYKNNGTLYVNSAGSAIVSIKVFNIQGRLIAEQKEVNATTAAIKNLKATQQVVLVQVTSEDGKVVTKKVVN